MRRVLISGLFLVFGATGIGGLAAAPPPPPPPGAIERAEVILQIPRHGDLTGYVGQFAENVMLTEKQAVVARGRDELLRYFRERQILHIKVLEVSYGNPIMATESVSNFPDDPKPGVAYDCCFWARVATYHLNDAGKVDRVEFIENGSFWGRPEHPR